MYDHMEYADYMGEDEDDVCPDCGTARRTAVDVTYSETATIYGDDNDSTDVRYDPEAEGTEFCIKQTGDVIVLSIAEVEALVEVLVRFLVSRE